MQSTISTNSKGQGQPLPKQTFIHELKDALSLLAFAGYSLGAVQLLERIYEYFLVKHLYKIPENGVMLAAKGFFLHDTLTLTNICLNLAIPYLVLYMVRPKFGVFFLKVSFIILIVFNAVLLEYFGLTNTLLGPELLGLSFEQILSKTLQSGGVSYTALMGLCIFPYIFYQILQSLSKTYRSTLLVNAFYIGFVISLPFADNAIQLVYPHKPTEAYNFVNNKLAYFFFKTEAHFADKEILPMYDNFYLEPKSVNPNPESL